MVKHKDAMAKMIMDEMRESEEDPPNCPAGSARSEYSKSLEKKERSESRRMSTICLEWSSGMEICFALGVVAEGDGHERSPPRRASLRRSLLAKCEGSDIGAERSRGAYRPYHQDERRGDRIDRERSIQCKGTPHDGVINVIVGGKASGRFFSSARKAYARQVMSVDTAMELFEELVIIFYFSHI
ncbi:hypothetical protein CRG98_036286 [Punica granatum]|uniref:Uncharacterized protein n=1 Tax=Punica granatum TaxID=22663 RepID=A0A2I0IIZ9_PUNGR|nr:hypothetical protein CRG98_036286 [Punica granatum]